MSILRDEYFDQVIKLIGDLKGQKDFIEHLASEIVSRALNGKYIFFFGTGGSAATASHFVGDLSKNTISEGKPKVKALCLSDNIPTLTAWANDEYYENIFSRQLETYANPGDLVIAISCSGNSLNVLKAVEIAKQRGLTCFALCGFDGGRLAKLAEHTIINPAEYIQQVEDIHLFILHLTSLVVKEKLEGKA